MPQADLLRLVVGVLDNSGIDHMVTGSLASSLHGEPRATHDIDLVVQIESSHAPALLDAFPPPRFYLSGEAIRDAIATDGTFNLLDSAEGDRVDFWLLTADAFDRSRFARKYAEDVLGIRLKVSTPEDTILQKLRWAEGSGGSETSFTDALRVYEVQQGTLDLAYLHDWVGLRGLDALWGRLLQQAEAL
jgi:hypothetical protein